MSAQSLASRAATLDARDPLRALRDQFVLPKGPDGQPLLYFCGHSLGLAPRDARRFVAEELADWEAAGVAGHHTARRPWIEYAEQLRPGLARLAGASSGEVVAMNSLTVNLHLLMASFYRPQGRRRCIVVEQGAFSSDRHAVVSQILWHGLTETDALLEVAPRPGEDLTDESELEELLGRRGDEIALVLWPGVQYRTGQSFDLARIANAAHTAGARCGFDLAHTIGNVPLALHDAGADFAVWCHYKYLNAGPGAIGGAFVHDRHHRSDLPGLAGWWGHDPASRFRMEPGFVPAPGAAAWQVSNPPILSAAPLLASLQLFDSASLASLREKSLQMNALLLEALDATCGQHLQCITPREPARSGCQLSLRVRAGRDAGKRVFETLGRMGVVADWREPDILRVAPVPMYNTHAEVVRLAQLLGSALEQHA